MFSQQQVIMPRIAETHIQKTAPGPPEQSAVATPTMLPVPRQAARAEVSAPSCETEPSEGFDLSFLLLKAAITVLFIHFPTPKIWKNPFLAERKKPVPRKTASIGIPHTNELIAELIS